MNTAVDFACELIQRRSITPHDAGCQDLVANYLVDLGFTIEFFHYGAVTNCWARLGKTSPLVCFAGHTDVVEPGNLAYWHSDPFEPTLRDDYLYGRGAADMKSSIAAFVVATNTFVKTHPHFDGSIAFLLTSGEEGDTLDGTNRVVDTLLSRGEMIDFCLVGEPTSDQNFGDTIKIGRRGSLTGHLLVKGKQGHIAYPNWAINPIHVLAPALAELASTKWDKGNRYFQPTSWQAYAIHAKAQANNMTPSTIELDFNFRFCTESSADSLKKQLVKILNSHGLNYELEWYLSSEPFLISKGKLAQILQSIISETTGQTCQISTHGGTSDARFIRHIAKDLVEFGPLNTTIHQTNECIKIGDINQLAAIHLKLLTALLIDSQTHQ